MEKENQPLPEAHICPHLGCRNDRATPVMYATWQASCFALSEPLSISPEHQNQFCLKVDHTQCPFYVAAQAGPEAAGVVIPKRSRRKRASLIIGSILVVLLIAVSALFFFQTSRGQTLGQEAIAPVATIMSQSGNSQETAPTEAQPSPTSTPAADGQATAEPASSPSSGSFRPVPPPP